MDVGGQPTFRGIFSRYGGVGMIQTIITMLVGVFIGIGISVLALVIAMDYQDKNEKGGRK